MTNERPLITFILVAYNQEEFIAEAVQGAFDQTYSPLQVILSDDYSTDHTFAIMEEMVNKYKGPHQIIARRNENNLGLGAHINRLMQLAKGELIVAAAGDDVSLPLRTERLWQTFLDSDRKAYSIFSNEYLIDICGIKRALNMQNPPNPERLTLEWFTQHQSSVTGSSHAWHRATFDIFGPLADAVMSEDAAIPFRSLLLGTIVYIHEPLVLRRYTGNNLSLGALTGENQPVNIPRFRSTTLRHARNFMAVYETRLHDVGILLDQFPERKEELSEIKTISEKKLIRSQVEVNFWQASNLKKLRMLYSEFLRNGFRSTAVRLSLSWLFPVFYVRWFHYRWLNRIGKLSL